MTELEPLLPCPFCGSDDVDEDYADTILTADGPRDEFGWAECNNCRVRGPVMQAEIGEVYRLHEMVREAWNHAPRMTNSGGAQDG